LAFLSSLFHGLRTKGSIKRRRGGEKRKKITAPERCPERAGMAWGQRMRPARASCKSRLITSPAVIPEAALRLSGIATGAGVHNDPG
jgi:hypothetical protein